jgi:hypothetical protein
MRALPGLIAGLGAGPYARRGEEPDAGLDADLGAGTGAGTGAADDTDPSSDPEPGTPPRRGSA